MKILVAEDGRTSALVLRLVLEDLGHDVTVATTGLEAWEHIRREDWPIIITDWMMPGIEGIELCRRIRSREGNHYSYVILLTSRDSHADRLAGLEAGADDFLSKPFDPEELNVRVKIAKRILAVQEELAAKNRELVELATTDALTGLKNRRYFLESLGAAFAYARCSASPLSVLMLDVDDFKSYNDNFGHSAGDDALRGIGGILRSSVREYGIVSRYGGEEFAVILQGTTIHSARMVGERIRAAVLDHPWPLFPITVSIGNSTTRPGSASTTQLIGEADIALYESKKRGRNVITNFEEIARPIALHENAIGPNRLRNSSDDDSNWPIRASVWSGQERRSWRSAKSLAASERRSTVLSAIN